MLYADEDLELEAPEICNGYYCTVHHPTLEDLEHYRNAAAVRVRARRRIFMACGIHANSVQPLAEQLGIAMKLEARR